MKLNVKFLTVAALFAFVLSACSDKDAEKKIAELENRLAELETSGASTTTPANNTATTTTAATEEVKPEGPLPTFTWSEEEHDFGTISEGDVVEHTFTFTNNGEAPLIIESARASCGCTVPSWTKEPVPVGGTGEIQVKFDSKGKPNVQNKTVTITANTYPKVSRLRIKTFVTPAGQGGDGPVKR